VTNRESFDSAGRWKRDIDAKVFLPIPMQDPEERFPIPVLLLGNKADVFDEAEPRFTPCATDGEVDKFVREQKFDMHFRCSAKTGLNIEAACHHLIARVAENIKLQQQYEAEAKAAEGGMTSSPSTSSSSASSSSSSSSAPTTKATTTVKLGSGEEGKTPEKQGGCCS